MKLLSSIAVAAFMLSGAARADFLCVNPDQSIKIQTYQLTGDETLELSAQKAAAILKLDGVKSIGTGTVAPVLNRVGGWERFALVDEAGTPIGLTTITSFRPGQCNRAGCEPDVQVITAKLIIQDTTHALSCTANSF